MTITRLDVNTRMSSIVIHNNTVYLCGQVAKDKFTDINTQTITMLEEVESLLVQSGSRRDAPARACVQAAIAEPEYLVEISVIAAVAS
jgi:enamine deaminase RidA (YjgF/YER057c/UK114 family)